MHEFTAWPKTARLFRTITITEKLDGTNSAIHISALGSFADAPAGGITDSVIVNIDGTAYVLTAQSRKRIITPGKSSDNYGFACWVHDNGAALVRTLGEGLHFGEWWGKGIQRGYGLDERRFSLFNTDRYDGLDAVVGSVRVGTVPVLYRGPNDTEAVKTQLRELDTSGSVAAPGFMHPEGVCVFHSASRQVLKATLDNNDAGKWEADARLPLPCG